ncbi:flagellar basal-body rod modification protein FlgD [Desulfonatronum thiosulfatophilum]|uniref:Basal-body rod modification protein FlgD n=1 Tax=Desulfonatronum thiosulfatophilum TaxID=617002 RepID=A0A1G6E361_9BACT|nr:flagellar hook capping FlgD N-terminal domain-containing protein [Desulfonatronum thiosulfatophilum]SDB51884.1 flagellar basal-body rod modification protein FlgD [Desulfonatronum thiosulfatophilum]
MNTSSYVSSQSSHLIGRAERDFETQKPRTGGQSALDKDAFLRLLTTQLANQDPLNPLDDKEFVTQLAQFSSLEQLNNISDSIGEFKETFSRQETLSAVNYIGKEIRAEGRSISKNGTDVSSFSYTLPDTAEKLYLNIFDNHGNIVRSVTLPGRMPGEHQFAWDGKDHGGNSVQDGVYQIFMAAEGVNGEPLMISTKTSGVVSGIVNDGDQAFLRLQDGRRVNIKDVTEVVGDKSKMGGTA